MQVDGAVPVPVGGMGHAGGHELGIADGAGPGAVEGQRVDTGGLAMTKERHQVADAPAADLREPFLLSFGYRGRGERIGFAPGRNPTHRFPLRLLEVEQLGDQDVEHAVVARELAQARFPHQDGHDILLCYPVFLLGPAQQVFLFLQERNAPFHPLLRQEHAREIRVSLVLYLYTSGRGHLDQLRIVHLAALRPVEQRQELRLGDRRSTALPGSQALNQVWKIRRRRMSSRQVDDRGFTQFPGLGDIRCPGLVRQGQKQQDETGKYNGPARRSTEVVHFERSRNGSPVVEVQHSISNTLIYSDWTGSVKIIMPSRVFFIYLLFSIGYILSFRAGAVTIHRISEQ